jgi:hypothetical protein
MGKPLESGSRIKPARWDFRDFRSEISFQGLLGYVCCWAETDLSAEVNYIWGDVNKTQPHVQFSLTFAMSAHVHCHAWPASMLLWPAPPCDRTMAGTLTS